MLALGRVVIGARASVGERAYVPGGAAVAPGASLAPLAAAAPAARAAGALPLTASGAGSLPPLAELESVAVHKCEGASGGLQRGPADAGLPLPPARPPAALVVAAAAGVALLHGYAFAPATAVVAALYSWLRPFRLQAGWGVAASDEEGAAGRFLAFLLFLIPVIHVLIPASYYVIVLLVKHAVLGRPRRLEGGRLDAETPARALRHWALGRLLASPLMAAALAPLGGTAAAGAALRLLGARVGARVMVPAGVVTYEPDLLELGDDSELGGGVLAEWGARLAPRAAATNGCVLGAGASVGAGAILGDMSYLLPAASVPACEIWVGGAPGGAKRLRRNHGAELLLEAAGAKDDAAAADASVATATTFSGDGGGRGGGGGGGFDAFNRAAPRGGAAEAPGAAPPDAVGGAAELRAALADMRARYAPAQAAVMAGGVLLPLLLHVPFAVLIWLVRGGFLGLPSPRLALCYFAVLPPLALAGSLLQVSTLVWECVCTPLAPFVHSLAPWRLCTSHPVTPAPLTHCTAAGGACRGTQMGAGRALLPGEWWRHT